MSPSTPNLGIVYPDSGGSTRLWDHFQTMATSIDTAIGALPLCRRVGENLNTASTGTFTTTETITDSITINLISGKEYELLFDGNFNSSVANDAVQVKLREDNVTGTELNETSVGLPVNSLWFRGTVVGIYTAVATGAKTLVATGKRVSGTGNITRQGGATLPSLLRVNQVS